MDDWNDLRLVLAVARRGSLTGAAQSLGINHSTAFRRLNAAEGRLGVRLFERLPNGLYLATAAGDRMAETAERIETETAALDREIAGHDHRLTGQLRVTSSDTLAHRLATGHFARFRQMHPGIVIELTVDNRVLSLSRREADIALRPARPKEGDLFGRKLADIAWTAYGAPPLLARRAPMKKPAELADMPMIGWSADAGGIPASDWLASFVSPTAWVYRSNSLINQFMAAKAGIGLVLLPCYLGDSTSDLRRAIATPIPELMRELWIVTHSDLRRTARIRAFFDVVGDGLAAERALFAGEHPQAS
ncbi:MAG: LysR family transcriptional regulator [Rhodospirillaceae bacterium]|nr:MAG: LysR family transcriptional regulator [Rhodospirillaceae bacterium]